MVLSGLFPESVVTQVATPEMWFAPLHSEEERCVRHAVPKRRREFAAGRACARAALARFGVSDAVLRMAPGRFPVWPDGFVGSITHAPDLCASAVGRSREYVGIGLDVERDDPLARDLIDLVCAAEELAEAHRRTGFDEGLAAKILFGAKEAVFKCFHPRTRAWWDFGEVTVLPDASGCWAALLPPPAPQGSWPRVVEGRFAVRGGWVVNGIALRREAADDAAPGAVQTGPT